MKRKHIVAIILICICIFAGSLVAVLHAMGIALNESGSKADVNDSVDFSKVGYSDFYANAENLHVNNSIYEEEAISKMSKIAENEFLELYLDEVETVVGIRDKKSGALWFSNPVNEEEETFSSGYYQKILKSQLYLTYIDKNTKINTMNNYTSSIENGQFEIEKMENGVKITYLIADSALTIQLPDAISVERMEKFLELMSAEQAKKMKRNYTLYSYGSLEEDKKEELLALYPVLKEQDLYVLRSGTKDYMREELAGYLAEVGYTQADYELDCKNLADGSVSEDAWFRVPLIYQLDGANLVVTVSPEMVEYNSDNFYLVNIDVLRYFGASLNEDGYLFVPDGSGALINFNNGKTAEASYSASVYGQDATMIYTTWYQSQVDVKNTVKMPVYGIKDGEKALFAIIEEGDAYATIKADISGVLTGYNDVYSSFTYLQYGATSLDDMVGAQTYYMYSDAEFEGDYTIRYSFLTGNRANYSGMAACYRNYLVETGAFVQSVTTEAIPFYVEYIGAIDKPKTFLGIKYDAVEALTTFKQAKEITQLLQENGVENLNVIYSGWTYGGLQGSAITSFKTEPKLNTGVTLADLQGYMSEAGIDLYMTLDFQYVYKDTLIDGYTGIQYAPRYFDNTVIKINKYGMASRVSEGTLASLISPYYVKQITDTLCPKLTSEGVTGVNLGTLSWELYSDLQSGVYTDRQMAERENKEAMQTLDNTVEHLIGDNANAYTWRYVKELVNVPMYSNNYRIIDEEVPFYEMVIHGYISYAGEAVNLADDYETARLKSVECGAGLNYLWIYEKNSLLKETEFDYLYSVNYEAWLEEAVADYEKINKEMGYLQCYEMISHEYLDENVAKVVYSDGSCVYVNYTEETISVDGVKIPARDYVVTKEAP